MVAVVIGTDEAIDGQKHRVVQLGREQPLAVNGASPLAGRVVLSRQTKLNDGVDQKPKKFLFELKGQLREVIFLLVAPTMAPKGAENSAVIQNKASK